MTALSTLNNNTNTKNSVLIIGVTGRTGLACLEKLASRPQSIGGIHALCRNASKLGDFHRGLLDSITEGDARNATDIQRALEQSQATVVLVCVGNGDDVSKSDIRTANAQALVQVLGKKNQESMPENVRVIAVSSTGAGGSRIKVGMGIGKMIEHHLRHVLRDHNGQEEALQALPQGVVTIVRPTALGEGAPTMQALLEFGDLDKSPTIQTDRADLADWVVQEVATGKHKGQKVNVTGVKISKKKH
eukprot:CAMPEP_0172452560 /NCGR_PEP_ID=MMETSP1065-20121228/10181_1 /TAXON_ID=265537 /ORGANISM="Amphiprora paludosa, Strain CCMP125" /LENGTH=245 /DNA_ID=CAMNT_0013204631 /DNA_START=87 /DNA_END=824 /DNA_ORIENTATION=+